jgi:hypothetical protein
MKKVYNCRGISLVGQLVLIVVTIVVLSAGLFKWFSAVQKESKRKQQVATLISDYGFQYLVSTASSDNGVDFEKLISVDSVSAQEAGYGGGWFKLVVEKNSGVDSNSNVVIEILSIGYYLGKESEQRKTILLPK